RLVEICRGQRIDLAVQLEAIGGGKVPPELVFLTHNEGKAAPEGIRPLPRREAEHAGGTARWVDQARKHFQGRGLAGAVWSQEGDHLAGLNGKVDSLDGPNFLVFSPVET